MAKQLEAQLADINAKLDDSSRNSSDLNQQKGRMQSENADLTRQLEEAENQANQLGKAKTNLTRELDECKNSLEEEARIHAKLQGDVRAMKSDLDAMREQLEEEQEGHADAQRLLGKAQSEITSWRQKFEAGGGGVRAEEMDDLKRKLNARLADAESQLEGALSRVSSLDKAKNRMQNELEDVMIEMERVSNYNLDENLRFPIDDHA